MKVFRLFLLIFILPFTLSAQGVDMADTLRQSGKIYVVVAVIAVIFAGLAIYLVSMDTKISTIQKQLKKQ